MGIVLFVVVPIVEIVAAAVVAHFIGWAAAILALVVLSLLGMWQIKVQGIAAWQTAYREFAEGASPGPTVLDGAMRLTGAVLLAAPGFVSALIGGILLIRPARSVASRHAGGWIVTRFGLPFVVVRDDGVTGWRFGATWEADVVDVEGWEDPPAPTTVSRPTLPPGESRY